MPTPSGGIAAYIADYIASTIAGSLVGTAGGFFSGASIDMGFQTGNYFGATPANLTTVRASTALANDASGNWTSFANNIPRITNLGLLVEEARTNGIRNNSMQGTVPGTPGTRPTNWDVPVLAGLTQTIVGVGTSLGVDYIDIRYNGTSSSTSVQQKFEAANQIAALNAQTWGQSLFVALVGGSFSNVTQVRLGFDENDVGGVFLAAHLGSSVQASITSALARFSNIATNGNASTAFVVPYVQFTVNNASAVDFTIRIGWPQLELGASVTSPIRTTAAAVTRALDAIILTAPPVFGSAYSMFAQGTPQAPIGYALNQVIFNIDDGTFNNDVRLWRTGAGELAGYQIRVAGVPTSVSNTLWSQNASGKLAGAFAVGDQVAYFGGVQQGTSVLNPLPAGISQVVFGNSTGAAQFFDGFIERIALWPTTRIPNSQLQAITT